MATTPMVSQSSVSGTERGPGLVAKFSYAMMFLGALALAVSGIGTFALGTPPMTHWILMLHVGASPLFAVGLALVALTWPGRLSGHGSAVRFFFWLLLLCGLIVILSGVVPMMPVFGTENQHLLYLTHRYSAMALAAIVILHLIALLMTAPRPARS